MNVVARFVDVAARMPAADAIIDFSGARVRRVSFAAFSSAVGRAGALLRSAGLRPGDAVLVMQPMSVELYVALAAVVHAGLAAIVVDPSAGREAVERGLALWPPAALICSRRAQMLRLLWPALRRIPKVFDAASLARAGGESVDVNVPPEAVDDDVPALVTFTSGSTGTPKAAVRTHGVLAAQLEAMRDCLHLESGGVAAATLPIVPLANLACGVTTVIPDVDVRRPALAKPSRLAERMIQTSADSITTSPALLERLAEYCSSARVALPSLRRISVGGAPVFAEALLASRAIAPHAEIVAVYGSTEAEPIASLDARDVSDDDREAMRSGSGLLAGRAVGAATVRLIRILRDRSAPATAADMLPYNEAAGEVGEIAVAGPHVVPGYLRGVGDSETKVRVGDVIYHRTGDLGRLDAQGRLWLLGRCVAAVRDSRGDLFPFAVECAVRGFAGVRRSALADVGGRRVLAVEGSDIDLSALARALSWARLDEVRLVRTIPVDRRHNAKVDYPALRRVLARR